MNPSTRTTRLVHGIGSFLAASLSAYSAATDQRTLTLAAFIVVACLICAGTLARIGLLIAEDRTLMNAHLTLEGRGLPRRTHGRQR